MHIWIEEDHNLPLVEAQWTFRLGAVHDPIGREGLTRLLARVIRMGTETMNRVEVEERISALGAQLSIDVSMSEVRFSGVVITKNMRAFFELVAELLSKPALREDDIAQAKREVQADLISLLDSDRALVDRFFRRALFGSHPYGRSLVGTAGSIESITRHDLVTHYHEHYAASHMIVGIAGDVDASAATKLVQTLFGSLGGSAPAALALPLLSVDDVLDGPCIQLVNKPERTQTQLLIGTLGVHIHDPLFTAMLVANNAFGGTFTSRLMREVRSKRGWSYGASSRLGADRGREAWSMFTFPAAKDAVDCLALQLNLYEAWWDKGCTAAEIAFSRENLAQGYAFEIDTPAKRLEQTVDIDLYGLPEDYYLGYVNRVRGVSESRARRSIQRRLSRDKLVITMLATAETVIRPLSVLAKKRKMRLETIPFDAGDSYDGLDR